MQKQFEFRFIKEMETKVIISSVYPSLTPVET